MDDVTTNASEVPQAEPERKPRAGRNQAFDVALGARIRALRIAADMSQGVIGQAIGVSFQQVQKYEQGKDRVSAGTLKAIADALGVHPGVFFDSDTAVPTGLGPNMRAAAKAAAVLQRVDDPGVLRRLLDLAKALGSAEGGAEP